MLKDLLIRIRTRIPRSFLFMYSVGFIGDGNGYQGSGLTAVDDQKLKLDSGGRMVRSESSLYGGDVQKGLGLR